MERVGRQGEWAVEPVGGNQVKQERKWKDPGLTHRKKKQKENNEM